MARPANWSLLSHAERLPLQPVPEPGRQGVLVAHDRVALGEAAQPEQVEVDGGGPALGDQLGQQAPTAGDFLKPVPEKPPATNSPATPGAASSTARLSAEVS